MADNRRKKLQEEDFDIKKLIAKLLDHWKLYVVSFIFFIILAVLFIRYSTPLYKADAQVLVQDDQSSSNSSFSLLGGSSTQDLNSLFGIKNNVYNELGILQTQDLLYKVIKDMDLNVSYFRSGNIRSVELYHQSPFKVNFTPISDSIQATVFDINFPKQGADRKYTIKNSDLNISRTVSFGDTIKTPLGVISLNPTGQPFEDAGYFFQLTPSEAVVAEIIKNLSISITDDNTTIVSLSYNSNIPKKAEDLLKILIGEYTQRNLVEKNRITDSTLAFVNERILIVSAELNSIETDIQEFKQKNKLTDITAQSKVLIDNASTYYNKLNEVDVQINVIKSMLTLLLDDKNSERPVPSTLNNDPTFLSLVGRYNSLLLQRDGLLLTTTDQNPYIQNLDIQIANLRNDLIKSLQNQQNAFEISKNKMMEENSLINSTIMKVPQEERTFIGLSREQSVKQALYLYLLQKKEETAITKASNMPSAAIIQMPKTEYQPYFPPKPLVLVASVFLAFLIPTGFIVLKYTLSNIITERDDITDKTDCSILAEIGHSEHDGLIAKDESRSVVAEQFRILRTNMDFLTGQKQCPKILITSSMSGEGKSFIACNLAQVLALSGKKVLMMEMDLRKPKLSSMLGMSNSSGFSNFIISGRPVKEFIKPVPDNENLFLISSGPIPPNPAELLMTQRVHEMFLDLQNIFDIIIMDCPPIGAVTDAQILATHSDVNLYIVRQGFSHKASIEIINNLIETKKLPNLYIVVNDIKRGASYRYGYGYGYGYGYSYGNETKKSKSGIFKIFRKKIEQ